MASYGGEDNRTEPDSYPVWKGFRHRCVKIIERPPSLATLPFLSRFEIPFCVSAHAASQHLGQPFLSLDSGLWCRIECIDAASANVNVLSLELERLECVAAYAALGHKVRRSYDFASMSKARYDL